MEKRQKTDSISSINIKEDKDLNDLKKIIDETHIIESLKQEQIKVNSKLKQIYIATGISFLLLLIAGISVWVFPVHIIFKAISIIVLIPITVCYIIFILIRMFVFGDFDRIRGKVILTVSSNYIIADFFMTQHRIKSKVCILNRDGISFNVGEQEYIIDYNCIWTDSEGKPHSFYTPNIPNPLKFDFVKYFRLAMESFRKQDNEVFNENLDVMYSSDNLRRAKLNDYVSKLHKDNKEREDRLFTILMIVIALAVIIIVGLVVYFTSQKPDTLVVVQNATTANLPRVV